MSTAENLQFASIDSMDFVLNLEVLNKCAHHCTGCFVNRRNNLQDVDLGVALELATAFNEQGLRFREVIISPTDLFSAENALDVLNDPSFQQLMRIHEKTRITSTAMFEDMDWDKFEAIFEVLDSDAYKSNMILEFLVPMNVEKLLSGDLFYFDQFNRVLTYFKSCTPKEIDWSFVVNVHQDQLLQDNFDEVTRIAKEQFGTIIEFLPSFFRTGNDTKIEQHLKVWDDFLTSTITEDNYQDIALTIADKNHNSFNTLVLNYSKGSIHISPFIYEQIISDAADLAVPGFAPETVMDKYVELIAKQYAYTDKTTECTSCDYMTACVGRNVLSFMEDREIVDCVYPKGVLDLYQRPNTQTKSNRVQRCANATNTK